MATNFATFAAQAACQAAINTGGLAVQVLGVETTQSSVSLIAKVPEGSIDRFISDPTFARASLRPTAINGIYLDLLAVITGRERGWAVLGRPLFGINLDAVEPGDDGYTVAISVPKLVVDALVQIGEKRCQRCNEPIPAERQRALGGQAQHCVACAGALQRRVA